MTNDAVGPTQFLGFGTRRFASRPPLAPPPQVALLPTEPVPTPDPGIDSGRAWLVVLASFLSTSTAFFITYSFTAFLEAMGEEFGTGKGSTALLFSLTIFFLFVFGLPAGRASDRWGPRPVVLAGTTFLVSGLLLTSVVSRIEVGYVTYGLGIGLGVACCYVPVVTQVTGWFDRKRALALGVAVSGIGVGTILGPPITNELIESYGWRSTYRILAVVALVGLLATAALVRAAPQVAQAGRIDLRGLARNPVFRAMYFSGFLMSLGLFVPFVFLKPFAEDQGITSASAATLVSFLGIGSLGGRLVLAGMAGWLGLMRLYQLCFVIMALSFVVWLTAGTSFVALAVFAFVLGTAYGGYVALSPAAAAHLFGLTGLGAVLGAMYTAGGFGGLIGPPLAGWLRDSSGGYTGAIVAAMAVSVAGALVLRRAITLSAGTST